MQGHLVCLSRWVASLAHDWLTVFEGVLVVHVKWACKVASQTARGFLGGEVLVAVVVVVMVVVVEVLRTIPAAANDDDDEGSRNVDPARPCRAFVKEPILHRTSDV